MPYKFNPMTGKLDYYATDFVTNVNVTGNVTATYFVGNGSQVTNVVVDPIEIQILS